MAAMPRFNYLPWLMLSLRCVKYEVSVVSGHCALFGTLSASEIILEQVTLRRGMEGDTRLSGALDDPKTYSKNKVYCEEKELAAKAGIEIDQFLGDYYAKGFRKESGANKAVHYLLFYNSISAPQCKREYLIQRVRHTKIYYQENRKIVGKQVKYIVEVSS
ncbi:MAG: hypothetical protein E5Y64_22885 [Mesorhizobium sp.]|nr:MAG: hypothetical protein E5Y64_22885 [Mesorhizobium sp.]TIN13629.1 MAG: hypothetical protein E5Y59_13695 [Mesorhizobium sp.]